MAKPATAWLVLILGLAGCSCDLITIKPEPIHENDPNWPPAPQKVALERNWTSPHGMASGTFTLSGNRGYVLGSIYPPVNGTYSSLMYLNLDAGGDQYTLLTTLPLNDPWFCFSDGDFVYTAGVRGGNNDKHFNEFQRTRQDGSAAGRIFAIVPGYENDYKNKDLDGLAPEEFQGVWNQFTQQGRKIFYTIEYPSLRGSFPITLPLEGGLYCLDLDQIKPTATPDEYTVTLKKVLGRTNPLTRYSSHVAFANAGGKNLILIPEVFQKKASLPPYDSYPRQPNLAFCQQNVALHAVDLDSGQEVWRFVDPWTFEYESLMVWKDKVWYGGMYRSSMVNLTDGQVVWQSDPFTGEVEGEPSTLISGDLGYTNKKGARTDNLSLEVLDLNTGKTKWSRYQYATQGDGLFLSNGILYVINQIAVRLYNAETGEYLAKDDSILGGQSFGLTNKSFAYGKNFIIIGDSEIYSIKLNYKLDLFGHLVKEQP